MLYKLLVEKVATICRSRFKRNIVTPESIAALCKPLEKDR